MFMIHLRGQCLFLCSITLMILLLLSLDKTRTSIGRNFMHVAEDEKKILTSSSLLFLELVEEFF